MVFAREGKARGGGTETEKIYLCIIFCTQRGGKEHKTQVSVSVSGD